MPRNNIPTAAEPLNIMICNDATRYTEVTALLIPDQPVVMSNAYLYILKPFHCSYICLFETLPHTNKILIKPSSSPLSASTLSSKSVT